MTESVAPVNNVSSGNIAMFDPKLKNNKKKLRDIIPLKRKEGMQ